MWVPLIDDLGSGRITFKGTVPKFRLPNAGSLPNDMTAGPDGALWFTERGESCGAGNRIGRTTAAGVVSEFNLPAACSRHDYRIHNRVPCTDQEEFSERHLDRSEDNHLVHGDQRQQGRSIR